MKQNAGLIVVMTMFLASFGLSNLPKSIPSGRTVPETTSTSKTKSSQKQNASNPTLSPACEEIGVPLEPLLEGSSLRERQRHLQITTFTRRAFCQRHAAIHASRSERIQHILSNGGVHRREENIKCRTLTLRM
jgi:hypothetical protein